jgi:8-oxo-dGTP diphosphatase
MPAPKTPLLAVDIILELDGKIVLIERKNPPHGWALPGGFVDIGEAPPHAAVREAKEEIDVDVEIVALLGAYGAPDRDPRGHTVSLVYVARAPKDATPKAGDDAGKVACYAPSALPRLAFDHAQVLADYLRFRNTGERPTP